MSFILDALRKAEDKNRNRHTMTVPEGPRVVTEELPQAPPAEGRSWLIWIVPGLLVAGLVWWLLATGESGSPPVSAAKTPTQSQPASSPAQQTVAQPAPLSAPPVERASSPRETGARALDREAQRGLPEQPAQRTARGDASNTRPQTATQSTTAAKPITPGTVQILNADGTAPSGVVPGQVSEENLPDYRTSLTSGEVPIPKLHLDMHVYSAEPEKRFVFINLEKYGEGDVIEDDTTIESIEPKGAVINHKGYRFVLLPD